MLAQQRKLIWIYKWLIETLSTSAPAPKQKESVHWPPALFNYCPPILSAAPTGALLLSLVQCSFLALSWLTRFNLMNQPRRLTRFIRLNCITSLVLTTHTKTLTFQKMCFEIRFHNRLLFTLFQHKEKINTLSNLPLHGIVTQRSTNINTKGLCWKKFRNLGEEKSVIVAMPEITIEWYGRMVFDFTRKKVIKAWFQIECAKVLVFSFERFF